MVHAFLRHQSRLLDLQIEELLVERVLLWVPQPMLSCQSSIPTSSQSSRNSCPADSGRNGRNSRPAPSAAADRRAQVRVLDRAELGMRLVPVHAFENKRFPVEEDFLAFVSTV
jgi:hypothetical protein